MRLYNIPKTVSIDLDIPPEFKKVGIHLSGGADSSLLLYLLGHILPADTELTVLSANIVIKDITRPQRTKDIITLCEKLHGRKYITHHIIDDLEVFENRTIKVKELFDTNTVDMFINGVTRNPMSSEKIYVQTKWGDLWDLDNGAITSRSLSDQETWFNSVDGIYTHVDSSGASPNPHYSPFINVDKSFIADLYRQYDLEDKLLPLTRSCEGTAEYTEVFTKPCGNCWWCLERKWAFGYF